MKTYIAHIPKTCTDQRGRGREKEINEWVHRINLGFEQLPCFGSLNGNHYRKEALDLCRRMIAHGPYPFLNAGVLVRGK